MANFKTDPAAMLDHSNRFANHSTTIQEEAQKAYQSAMNISGAGWSGDAEGTSMASVEQLNQAFRNIAEMTHWASTNIKAAHDTYLEQELQSKGRLTV